MHSTSTRSPDCHTPDPPVDASLTTPESGREQNIWRMDCNYMPR